MQRTAPYLTHVSTGPPVVTLTTPFTRSTTRSRCTRYRAPDAELSMSSILRISLRSLITSWTLPRPVNPSLVLLSSWILTISRPPWSRWAPGLS